MKRLIAGAAILAAGALGSGPIVGAADADDADVEHRVFPCSVGWTEEVEFVLVDCDIQNIRRPDGSYSIIAHGQIPDDRLGEFKDAGVRQFDAGCWVNYLFIEGPRGGDDPVDPDPAPVVSSGTRYFAPNGAMTEVCHLRP